MMSFILKSTFPLILILREQLWYFFINDSQIFFLRLDIEALERKSASYLKECLSLKNEVSNCIQKSTQMRCSSVIVGDCSLKLLRQHYLIGKQKEFLTFLSQQWAREQLVLLAIRLEGRQIESLLSILKNVTQEIVDGNQHLRTRLVRSNHSIPERTLLLAYAILPRPNLLLLLLVIWSMLSWKFLHFQKNHRPIVLIPGYFARSDWLRKNPSRAKYNSVEWHCGRLSSDSLEGE